MKFLLFTGGTDKLMNSKPILFLFITKSSFSHSLPLICTSTNNSKNHHEVEIELKQDRLY